MNHDDEDWKAAFEAEQAAFEEEVRIKARKELEEYRAWTESLNKANNTLDQIEALLEKVAKRTKDK